MESIEQFRHNVKNDERRLKFFVDKIKGELKSINIQYSDETIKTIILEIIDKYNDHSHMFTNYAIRYIKEKGDIKEKPKYPKNNIFFDKEMVIIDLYLNKDENGKYRSNEDIAKILGQDILTVSITIHKLKNKLEENPKEVKKIFGDIEHIIAAHKKPTKQKTKKKQDEKTKLTDDDIKILGHFTGQINDICIDIEDLASERHIKTEDMRERIIDIYSLLENEDNYKKLIAEFPQINMMLKFKGRAIGAKIPSTVLSSEKPRSTENPIFECANLFQTLYQKDADGNYTSVKTAIKKLGYTSQNTFYSKKRKFERQLEEDSEFKRKVIERYPTLLEDKMQYDQSTRKGTNNKNTTQRLKIPKEIEEDPDLLQLFYKLCKELYNIEVYADTPNEQKNSQISPKVIVKDIKYLKLIYTKNPINNKYRSASEISDEVGVSINTFYINKRRILNELENNPDYKSAIRKEYPLLDDDIKTYHNNKDKETKETEKIKEKRRKEQEKEIEERKINKIIKTLEYFYKKQENGKYLSIEEIAELLEIQKTSVYQKKKDIFKRLKNKEYKAKILEKWPTLDEDIQKRPTFGELRKKSNKQIDSDIQTLEYFYKKQENGKYLSIEEIAELLKIQKTSVYKKKQNIFIRLENEEYKAKILEKWPTLDEDIKTYHNNKDNETKEIEKIKEKRRKEQEKEIEERKINKIIKTLEYFYKKREDGTYYGSLEIANLLGLEKVTSIYNKRNNTLKLLENKDIKAKVLEKWPTLDEDIKKRPTFGELRKISNKLINRDVQTLEYFYKKQENGKYLSIEEIAELLEIQKTSVYQKRIDIFKRLKIEEYKAKILEKWPTLDEDIQKRPIITTESKPRKKSNQQSNQQIDSDIHILEYFYKKQENGKYLSTEEIAELLKIQKNSVYQKKINIFIRLENEEYKAKILEKWPTLDEDIKTKDNDHQLSEKQIQFANMLLTDQTRKLEKGTIYAKNLGITENYYYILKSQTLSTIRNNPNIQNAYPHFIEENEITTNHISRNSISISKNELDNIRKNSRKYDVPKLYPQETQYEKRNSKEALIKGIEKLEKSVYGDYASLCTVEQKAMLALRLGFFNNMEFSTETVSILFMTEKEEVSLLTTECIKSAINKKASKNAQKKIGTKN